MSNLPPTPTPIPRLTISRHYLRRRARQAAHRQDLQDPNHNYTYERAERGPYRWRCVRLG